MGFLAEGFEAFLSSQQDIAEFLLINFDSFEAEGFDLNGGLIFLSLRVFDGFFFFKVEAGFGVVVFEGFVLLLELEDLFLGALLLGRVESR
jgi:hypothetical protein